MAIRRSGFWGEAFSFEGQKKPLMAKRFFLAFHPEGSQKVKGLGWQNNMSAGWFKFAWGCFGLISARGTMVFSTTENRELSMNETITPLIFEHEGSQIEISQEGVTLSGPSIRMNSGPANAGDKVFQVGEMEVALGAAGVSINGRKIVLPVCGAGEGEHV
jgi:hypothetical protein